MSNVDERIERLIVRSLDGLLDDRQQLELDRQLIRNPHARRMMEAYRAADALAAAALAEIGRSSMGVDRIVASATRGSVRPSRARRFARTWMLVPGAAAAVLLAAVISKPLFQAAPEAAAPGVSTPADHAAHSDLEVPPLPPPGQRAPVPLRTVGQRPVIRRRAGTEWIGVVGDDGNVYWIELQRSRTIRTPWRQNQRQAGETFLQL